MLKKLCNFFESSGIFFLLLVTIAMFLTPELVNRRGVRDTMGIPKFYKNFETIISHILSFMKTKLLLAAKFIIERLF